MSLSKGLSRNCNVHNIPMMGLLPQGPDQQGPDLGLGPKNQSFNRVRSCPSLINPELSATLGTVVCMVDHSL